MGHWFSSEDFLLQCQINSLVKDSFSWEQSFIIKEEEEQCLSGLGQHLEVWGQSAINSVKAAKQTNGSRQPRLRLRVGQRSLPFQPLVVTKTAFWVETQNLPFSSCALLGEL